MSSNALNISGCITARSTAHVPPIENPAMPQFSRCALTPKFETMNGTTSLVRWSAEFPRLPLTHSVSLLNAPPGSTNTSTGALPPCAAAKSSAVLIALPIRAQSAGVLNSPPIIITAGRGGGGLVAYQAGGRYTSSLAVPETRRGLADMHRNDRALRRDLVVALQCRDGHLIRLIGQRSGGQLIPGALHGGAVPGPQVHRQRSRQQTQRHR